MKHTTSIALALAALLLGQVSQAGLIIHAAEMGIGKFHRYDNKVHKYEDSNIWKDYILADGVDEHKQQVTKNADGSYTIYFTNLEEMLNGAVSISKEVGQKVSILNLEAHGLPGGMWYPKSAAQRDSAECGEWRNAAFGDDLTNYNQYYSAVDMMTISYYRMYARTANHGHQDCVTGLAEWVETIAKIKDFDQLFAPEAEMHFISCIVGLDKAGDAFTKGIAQALFKNSTGKVMTSVNYGLGDWSLPEGMGFFDFQSKEQLDRDNADYVKNKKDRNIAQKGQVRIATNKNAVTTTEVFGDQFLVNVDVPFNGKNGMPTSYVDSPKNVEQAIALPSRLRIPGTSAYINPNL